MSGRRHLTSPPRFLKQELAERVGFFDKAVKNGDSDAGMALRAAAQTLDRLCGGGK